MKRVLAVDPGREKCGIAVVSVGGVLHRSIVPRPDTVQAAVELASAHEVDAIIVGNGTGGPDLFRELRASATTAVELIDEAFSTLKARSRFFRENPPRGLRRLIPLGLLLPDRPYDDYVAVILGEEYLRRA